MCVATANPLLALILTHSPVFAGYVGAAGTIPALLMYLPAGWFVDRFNRRLLMFVSQLGRLIGCALVIYAIGFQDHAKPMLIVAALCEGSFLVLYSAAESTSVQQVVSADRLPWALAMNEARGHLALMAGRPLGGFLFGQNKTSPYCVNVVTAVWSMIALMMMDKKNHQPPRADGCLGGRPQFSIFDGARILILSSFLRTVVVVCAVGNFFFQTVVMLLIVLAKQQHLSSARIGLLLATSGVAGLIGSAVAPKMAKRVTNEGNIIKLCAAAWAALTFVVAVCAQPVAGLIAWGGLSVTGGFLNVAIVTHQTRHVPAHVLGRVMGINRFLTCGAVPLGALSSGYIVAEVQPHLAAWIVFGAMLVVLGAVPVLLKPTMLLPSRTAERLKKRLTLKEICEPVAPQCRCASSDLDELAAIRATPHGETVDLTT